MTTTLESPDAKLDEVIALLKKKAVRGPSKNRKFKGLGERATKIIEFLEGNAGVWNNYQIAKALGQDDQLKKISFATNNLAKRKRISRVAFGTYTALTTV